jgi:hypothetical protein
MSLKNLAQWIAQRPARSRKARAKSKGPSSLGDLISALDGDFGTESGPVSQQVWQELVGTRIADRSQPWRIDPSGTLMVRVPDAIWAQELSLLSSAIIARLGAMGVRVTGLRFLIGQVVPPRRGPTRFERRIVAAPVELPESLKGEMDAIEDEGLRKALKAAAASSLAEAEAAQRRTRKRGRGTTRR